MNVTEFAEFSESSQNPVVTTSTTYLDIVTFSVIVIEITFSLLSLGRYLLPLM